MNDDYDMGGGAARERSGGRGNGLMSEDDSENEEDLVGEQLDTDFLLGSRQRLSC